MRLRQVIQIAPDKDWVEFWGGALVDGEKAVASWFLAVVGIVDMQGMRCNFTMADRTEPGLRNATEEQRS